jgi:hypothetical protein
MTPEERFSKIDKLLHTLAKRRKQFQIKFRQNDLQIDKQIDKRIDKQNAAIRALVVDSRRLLQSQKRARKAPQKAQRETADKLKALKDLVDGTIRKKPRKKNS